MSIKTYKMWQRGLSAVVGAVIAVSVLRGNAFVPIPTVIIGMLILFLLRRRVTEIMVDERAHAIVGKASRLTLQVGSIAMAVIGATLFALSRNGSSQLEVVALALGYATCGMLVIYCLVYYYFQNRLGGE